MSKCALSQNVTSYIYASLTELGSNSRPLAIFQPILPFWPSKIARKNFTTCTFPMGKPNL